MNTTAATQIPSTVKTTPSLTAVHAALLAGASGTSKEIAEAAGVKLTSAKEALKVLTAHGVAAVTPGSGVGKNSVPATWTLAVVEAPKAKAPKEPKTGGTPKVRKVDVAGDILKLLSAAPGRGFTIREIADATGRPLCAPHVTATLLKMIEKGLDIKPVADAKVKTFMYLAA